MARTVKCGLIQAKNAGTTDGPIEDIKQRNIEKHLGMIEDAGDRTQAARVANQPGENVPRRISEQLPWLHQNSNDASNQSARAKRNQFGKGIREIIGRRDHIGRDIHCERGDHNREHGNRDHDDLMKLAD